jgi:hypothetical protein
MVPSLLFSADILHTQGQSDFSFVNFLALVLRALRVLKNRVSIQIPTPNDSPFGIDVRDLYTRKSLDNFFKSTGILEDNSTICNNTAWDIRIGQHMHLKDPISKKTTVYSLHGQGSAFFDGIWSKIQEALVHYEYAHGIVCVSLLVMAEAPTPMSYGGMVYHLESKNVMRLLDFSTGLDSGNRPSCKNKEVNQVIYDTWKPSTRSCPFVHFVSTFNFTDSKSTKRCISAYNVLRKTLLPMNFNCMIWNMLHTGDTSNFLSNTSSDFSVLLRPSNLANGTRSRLNHTGGFANGRCFDSINLMARYFSLYAPFVVVEAPSHWMDITLAKRNILALKKEDIHDGTMGNSSDFLLKNKATVSYSHGSMKMTASGYQVHLVRHCTSCGLPYRGEWYHTWKMRETMLCTGVKYKRSHLTPCA